MKKILYILLVSSTLIACDKVYINGDLDGMWKLKSVEYPDSISYPNHIFYSFQRHLTQLTKDNDTDLPTRFLGNLSYIGNTITMSKFYSFPQEPFAATLSHLKEFHLYRDSTIFNIVTLNDETLIMTSDERTYTLQKW